MSEICRQNLAHLHGASFYLGKFLRFYRAQSVVLAQIQRQKGQINEF